MDLHFTIENNNQWLLLIIYRIESIYHYQAKKAKPTKNIANFVPSVFADIFLCNLWPATLYLHI